MSSSHSSLYLRKLAVLANLPEITKVWFSIDTASRLMSAPLTRTASFRTISVAAGDVVPRVVESIAGGTVLDATGSPISAELASPALLSLELKLGSVH